ncbi:recombination regulator RecX [Nocardia sp. NBC_01503]|uniref:recombination regulator RecX n=1 Tax=Nocardia sp. NBC_01503 TaxID=2975997 RepID=UPI003FA53C57
MTDRSTPEPRPTRPGPEDSRLEAVERLRRQLDALESRGSRSASKLGGSRGGSGRSGSQGGVWDTPSPWDDSGAKAAPTRWTNSGADSDSTKWSESSTDSPSRWSESATDSDAQLWVERRQPRLTRPLPSEQPATDDDSQSTEESGVRRRSAVSKRSATPAGDSADSEHTASDSHNGERGEGRRGRRSRRRGDGGAAANGAGDGDFRESGGARGGRRSRRYGYGPVEPLPGGGKDAQAKEICLRLLTDRDRSRAELADRLAAKGYSTEVADRVLNRLTEVGLINDAAFAQQWVYSRHTYSGKGKKVLAEELRRKGISPQHADEALASLTPEAESSRAEELVRQKLGSLPPTMDRDKATRRLVSLLARKGYDPGTAFGVVATALKSVDLPDPPRHRPPERGASGAEDVVDDGRHAAESGSGSAHLDPTAANSAATEPTEPDMDAATELVRRKLRTFPSTLDRQKAITRLAGMLARRGYNSSTAFAIVTPEVDAAGFTAAAKPAPRFSGPAAPEPSQGPLDEFEGADSDPGAELVRRKLRTFPPNLDRQKVITRLVGMLARRGYNQSDAYSLVKAELAAADLDR